MPMQVPYDVFKKVTEGYIAYWIMNGIHYLAYIDEDGFEVIEANSLDELASKLREIDFIEARGLCIFGDYNDPDSSTECIRAGFRGSEIIALLRGP